MRRRDTIGIVGQGFVGTAVREGLKNTFNIETYDKYSAEKSSCQTLEDLVKKTAMIFVCVPTPMKEDGSCDLSVVKSVIKDIDLLKYPSVCILKSTVPPGTTKALNESCVNTKVVFNPEFLTEANYINDFKNQNRIIVGGPRPASTKVKDMFRKAFPEVKIIKTGSDTAESVKYFTNCFLATKVSFANEFKQICESFDIDYDKVVEYSLYDTRIGTTHLSAPGPDGKSGFGGSCFPKDVNALISHATAMGVDPLVLKAVWAKNIEVRPEKDWEKLEGRAVSFKQNKE